MTCSAILVTDGRGDPEVDVGVEVGAERDGRCVATWMTE
jgi:hypothetical protein